MVSMVPVMFDVSPLSGSACLCLLALAGLARRCLALAGAAWLWLALYGAVCFCLALPVSVYWRCLALSGSAWLSLSLSVGPCLPVSVCWLCLFLSGAAWLWCLR